jgi:Flp pilus assembly protein TadG
VLIKTNNTLSKLRTDNRGSIAVISASCLVVMSLAVGIAIDFGRAATAATKLQSGVDAAALGLATGHVTAAQQADYVSKMMAANASNSNIRDLNFQITKNAETITVSATATVPTTLSSIIQPNVAIARSATVPLALPAGAPTACIYALAPTGTGLTIDSNGSMDADCGIQVNSASSNALKFSSGGTITSTSNCVVGGVSYDGGASATPAVAQCPAAADPLAAFPEPDHSSLPCDFTKKKIKEKTTVTLQPGVYCDGLDIAVDAKVTFNPGIYVMRDGPLKTSSHVTLTGSEVFFHFTGENSYLFVDSNSTMNFTAPKSGDFKGMLFYQDRNSTAGTSQIDSGNHSRLDGIVYFPNTNIHLDSNGETLSEWTIWVAKSIKVDSAASLVVRNYDSTSSTPAPDAYLVANRARLVN